MKRIGKCFILMLLVAVMTVPGVFAVSNSATKYVSVNGYGYTYYSTIDRSPDSKMRGGTAVRVNRVAPTGYMGAIARIFNAEGNLAYSGRWVYSASPMDYFMPYTDYRGISETYYYSRGLVCFYNGNSYVTYICNATVNLMQMSITQSMQAYYTLTHVNENGEIYGSALFMNEVGIEPDLIAAVGNDGVEGYIKAIDIDGASITSPDEAIQYEKEAPEAHTIPLYTDDGKTVIGSFTLGNTDNPF